MVPLDLASRRAFWLGLWVGIGFRCFVYLGCLVLLQTALSSGLGFGTWRFICWMLALFAAISPLLVPFLAGFSSAFFWSHIVWSQGEDKPRALWWLTLANVPFYLLLTSCLFHLLFLNWLLIVVLPLDYWSCSQGLTTGERFWNSRQGRQFFGDFSNRDDEREA